MTIDPKIERMTKALVLTLECCGTTLSRPALDCFLDELEGYPEQDVLESLADCRRSVRGRLALADVIERCDARLNARAQYYVPPAAVLVDREASNAAREEARNRFRQEVNGKSLSEVS
jgi:hypothetical protein